MQENPELAVPGYSHAQQRAPFEYAPLRPAHHKKPEIFHGMLISVVGLAALVDFLRMFNVGGITGLGIVTILCCGAVWAAWLTRPFLPNDLLKPLLALIMFDGYTTGSLLWSHAGLAAPQVLAVALSFLGLILLTARETNRNPAFAHQLQRILLFCCAPSILVYLWTFWQGGMGAEGIIGPRAFALFALVPIAVGLARWRAGNRQGLIWAGALQMTIFLSGSRTAMVVGLALIPLSVALRGNRKSLVLATTILVLAGSAFFAVLFTYQPLYDRFFAYDASMDVGGVAVNASGRTKMWNILLYSLGDDWVFGKGIGESGNLITQYFPEMGQPHNDFLRYYYDLGIFGLTLWLIFIGSIISIMAANLRRAIRENSSDYPLHLAPLLALAAILGSMFTDNSVSYAFVMMPLGIIIGCSLGVGRSALLDQAR